MPTLLELAARRPALWAGWAGARRNSLPGMDGQTPTEFAMGLTRRLDLLAVELASGTYRCGGVRTLDGGQPAIVMNVRDRIADGALRHAVRSLRIAHGARLDNGLAVAEYRCDPAKEASCSRS